jgi:hypothetical protein
MNNFKCIHRGEISGDCTSVDIFEATAPVTVKQMCDYIISQTSEWGEIGITTNQQIHFTSDCENHFEYFHGTYVDRNRSPIKIYLSPQIANSIIKKIRWHGGWTNADYLLYI